MSFPSIPNITPLISVTTAQVAPLLLASIALEELSLAHIMNAEAEKLQLALGTLNGSTVTFSPATVSLTDLLAVDASVQRTLRDVIKKEMLLEFKFENVLDLIATTTVPGAASLFIEKTDTPDPVVVGHTITYTISLANTGNVPLTNVTITDPTPLNTTFVSATAAPGFSATTPAVGGTGNVIFTSPSLAPSTTVTFQIVVRVNPGPSTGPVITNTVVADANEVAPVTASTTTTVELAGIAITKGGVVEVAAGNTITYTLTITSTGPAPVTNITITEPTPSNTTFVSATTAPGFSATTPAVGGTGNVVFTSPSLAPSATATFQIVVRVNPGTPAGTPIVNTAVFDTNETGPRTLSLTATVV